ncbi:hypothetical protein NQZ68_010271 [Dissostichus eleginoides]|nr:hypothetical protein NQZ68_010271 [Dissostichus eleginoides]
MAGVTRKGSGRPSYYYRFLSKSRLQRQRSRSRSRTRPSASRALLFFSWLLPPSAPCSLLEALFERQGYSDKSAPKA